MNSTLNISNIFSGLFAILLAVIGVLNVILVHPVPGAIYFLLCFIYIPSVNVFLRKRFGFTVPVVVKLILGIAIIIFTLGVSDLGDMIDKL